MTETELIRRINEALKPTGARLKRTEGRSGIENLGSHHQVDEHNVPFAKRVNITALGRELGILGPHEAYDEEG